MLLYFRSQTLMQVELMDCLIDWVIYLRRNGNHISVEAKKEIRRKLQSSNQHT